MGLEDQFDKNVIITSLDFLVNGRDAPHSGRSASGSHAARSR